MLLVSARPGVTRMAAGSPEFAVRPAKWPDDYDAVCAVRKPTEFVVEDGGAGFMGQRVAIVDPEEAQQRRVQARLSSALRDNATVLLVEDPPGGGGVVGTLDCVLQEHSREPGGAPEPRLLLRNLWVAPPMRRQGMARELMRAAEALAVAQACANPNPNPNPNASPNPNPNPNPNRRGGLSSRHPTAHTRETPAWMWTMTYRQP